jgi:hypothetical protein
MKPIGIIASLLIALVAYFVIGLGVRPTGPFEPLAVTDFFFDQTGVTKELVFNPRFCKNHEIAIVSYPPYPSSEEFKWQLRAEVFKFGIRIQEKKLNVEQQYYSGNSMDKFESLSFGWIRTLDILPGPVVVKIHVDAGDTRSSRYRDSFKVVVRPSGIM